MPKKKPLKGKNKQPSMLLEGTFSIGKNNIGYVKNKEKDLVIQIPAHLTNNAMQKDRVRIEITDKKNNTGKVLEILKSAKVGLSGTLLEKEGKFILVPTDARDPEITITDKSQKKNVGKKVFATIDSWTKQGEALGTITKVLGKPGENNAEMNSIALEKGFDEAFPKKVEDEADKLAEIGLTEKELEKRKDMRNVPTFTIDPEDAKDFDDALSVMEIGDGKLEVGIHIADVSYYVTPKSELDEEAKKRTTSVYLVDRTLPMLPEALSNDLCSLRPNEDKFTFSAVFTLSPKGEILEEWFGRTVIHSDKRFSYEEAQEVLDTNKGPFAKELATINTLAKHYTKERFKNGALSLDQPEVKFILDENGKPIKVVVKRRIDTNRLIEEFMLLANKRVAKFMSEKTKHSVFVYRVHDKPDPDRVMDLRMFLKSLGYNVHIKDGIIPSSELNALLREVDESDTKSAIQTAVVRSMSKAIYSTENIGHYGLGFTFYTHFTSPIRRYPDIMVHRLLQACLSGEKIPKEAFEEYERMAERSSSRERDAQEAEWASIKYKQVEYMSTRIGEKFEGVVSGMMKKGIFVAEKETRSEGMVALRNIPGDFYEFNEEKMQVIGKKKKKVFKIGDVVQVQVTNADLERKIIDYKLVQ